MLNMPHVSSILCLEMRLVSTCLAWAEVWELVSRLSMSEASLPLCNMELSVRLEFVPGMKLNKPPPTVSMRSFRLMVCLRKMCEGFMRLWISSMWNKGVEGWMSATEPRKAHTPGKREDSSSGIVDCVPWNCYGECGGYMTKSFKSFIHKHSRPIVDHRNSWVLETQYNALTATCIIVNVTGVKLRCRQAL